MLKNALKKLKDFFNDHMYGPYSPAPEVQKALEEKGYRFERSMVVGLHYAVESNNVYTPDNKALSRKDGTLQQYMADYDAEAAKFKAAKEAAEAAAEQSTCKLPPQEPK